MLPTVPTGSAFYLVAWSREVEQLGTAYAQSAEPAAIFAALAAAVPPALVARVASATVYQRTPAGTYSYLTDWYRA